MGQLTISLLGTPLVRHGEELVTFPTRKVLGVLIYLDMFKFVYGVGWQRENSFLSQGPNGVWCYSMNPHTVAGVVHPTGKGQLYRMTAQSPESTA